MSAEPKECEGCIIKGHDGVVATKVLGVTHKDSGTTVEFDLCDECYDIKLAEFKKIRGELN